MNDVNTPAQGTVRRAKELGRAGHARFIWSACIKCGASRWVNFYHRRNGLHDLCKDCGELKRVKSIKQERARNWRGGRYLSRGYVFVWIDPSSDLASMRQSNGYALEHRIVMARHIGRLLLPTEVVHHINQIKSDNRIENLGLLSSNAEHRELHKLLGALCR